MAKQKKKIKHKHHRSKDPIMDRSDIPFAQRSNFHHQARVNREREKAARIVLYCLSIAIHKVKGVGYRGLIRLSHRYEEYEREMYQDGVEVGLIRAKKRMDEMGLGISGELYDVPDVGGTVRDQDVANQSMEATQVALTAASMAMNDELGYGEIVQLRIHEEFSSQLKTYEEKGMAYLLEQMKEIGFTIKDGKAVFFIREDDKPMTPGQTKKMLEKSNTDTRRTTRP